MEVKEIKQRCEWARGSRLEADYHDNEWGVPVHDDQKLFEMLILEGAQAGLSWTTILKKRDAYLLAYDDFDVETVASYDDMKVEQLLGNAGIVRNRLKIVSSIQNAKQLIAIRKEFGSFDRYIWQFVEGKTIQGGWKRHDEIPAQTKESSLMSRDLKKRGFRFAGSTICYAFMQAVGMVNDHTVDCFRFKALAVPQ